MRSLGFEIGLVLCLTAPALAEHQATEAPRNMPAVQCKLNETALNLAAGSWARTLDIAQDQEAEIARLKAEIDTLKEKAADQ